MIRMRIERDKRRINGMINEILGVIYQEPYIYRGIVQSLNIDYERMKILHDILIRIDLLNEAELQEKIFHYGSLIREENLLARQVFLCLWGFAKEKYVEDN